MTRVKIFLIRHSKSCSNYLRSEAEAKKGKKEALIAASRDLRDADLSAIGSRMAREYGPLLRHNLGELGFNVDSAVVGSSPLRRAKKTAALLFSVTKRQRQRDLIIFPSFGEHGTIPENTPEGMRYSSPDWDALLRQIAHISGPGEINEFAIVGHGSYLRTVVWPAVMGIQERKTMINNLDGFLIDGDLMPDGTLTVHEVREIPYSGRVSPDVSDQCSMPMPNEIRRLTQRMSSKQRGAGYGMPLAYYNDGAQMQGTFAEPTGTGLAASSGSMVRAPLVQTGGSRQRQKRQKQQNGGFSASLMGSFAANGAHLLPVAGYLGYKMYKGSRKTARKTAKKTARKTTRKTTKKTAGRRRRRTQTRRRF